MSSKTQSSNKCAGCARDLLTSEQLKCTDCALRYHFECVNTANKKFKEICTYYKKTWVCPTCQSKKPKGDNSNTPVRAEYIMNDDIPTSNVTTRRGVLGSSHSPVIETLSLNNVKELIHDSMDNLLDRIERKMTKIIEMKTNDIFKEVNDLKDSIHYLHKQYEDTNNDLQLMSSQMQKLGNENENLRTTVKDLSNRLSIMEQHSRMSNVEIQCIPESKAENLMNVITEISKVTGAKLQEGDIHKCTRIAKINPENKRPRSVVVKFSSPRIRDTFMASVKQFNRKHRDDKLNTKHIGIGGEQKPVYVVDHLTPEMKKIHALARETAKKLNFKFVWTKNGRVFMRKTETSEHIVINDLSQLVSLV